MAKKNVVYGVKNVSAGVVIYKIPEINIRREFMPGETKNGISFEELEKLTYQAGGRELLANYLQIVDKKVLQDLGVPTEPEYFYTEEKIQDIENILQKTHFLQITIWKFKGQITFLLLLPKNMIYLGL